MASNIVTATATETQPLDGLAGWAVGVMDSLGGPGAAVVVGRTTCSPLILSELVLQLAGFSASQGTFSFGAALFWTTFGSVLGAVIVYAIGALIGRERTRALVVRIPLIKASDFDRTEAWFAKHGSKAVLLGRMIPHRQSGRRPPRRLSIALWRRWGCEALGGSRCLMAWSEPGGGQ